MAEREIISGERLAKIETLEHDNQLLIDRAASENHVHKKSGYKASSKGSVPSPRASTAVE